jgi:hypothetical protein
VIQTQAEYIVEVLEKVRRTGAYWLLIMLFF